MEAIIDRAQHHFDRAVELFKEQPKQVQVALGVVAAVSLLKLVWRPKRINTRGRRVLVTGAASGVGREVARILAAKGWRIWACDVNEAGLNDLAEFPNVTRCKMDVSSSDSCKSIVQAISADGGSLDALINVAGIVAQVPACGCDDNFMRKMFEINTIGPMRLIRDCIPIMLRSPRGGWVVNVTSIGGTVAWPWCGVYASTKAALNNFSDQVRREAGASRLPIRVSIIAPGPINTPMINTFTRQLQSYAKANPNDPFSPGIAAEGEFQAMLEARGWGTSAVSVTPLDVAKHIVDAVELDSPPTYVFVATLGFKCLAYAVQCLPTRLGDLLLMSL